MGSCLEQAGLFSRMQMEIPSHRGILEPDLRTADQAMNDSGLHCYLWQHDRHLLQHLNCSCRIPIGRCKCMAHCPENTVGFNCQPPLTRSDAAPRGRDAARKYQPPLLSLKVERTYLTSLAAEADPATNIRMARLIPSGALNSHARVSRSVISRLKIWPKCWNAVVIRWLIHTCPLKVTGQAEPPGPSQKSATAPVM